jgi:hypothetical protein
MTGVAIAAKASDNFPATWGIAGKALNRGDPAPDARGHNSDNLFAPRPVTVVLVRRRGAGAGTVATIHPWAQPPWPPWFGGMG